MVRVRSPTVVCNGVAISSTHQWCILLDYYYLSSNYLHSSHTRPPLTYYYHRGIQHDAHTAATWQWYWKTSHKWKHGAWHANQCSALQGLQQVLYYVYCNFQFKYLGVPGPCKRSHDYEPVPGMEWECIQTQSTHLWHMPICGISPRKHSVCPYKLSGLTAANGYFETQHYASWHGPQCIYPNSGDDWVTFLVIQYYASNGVISDKKKAALKVL